ncbi:transmembrane protein, putative [Medicago truncatula]|uniref:Transmembrane protein, putative n=1 Tax=Medicago truncatula TaxID=3880 RepID=G7ISX2_MEDTR|nr:transmembrane protein, putative [Medicago truncatula]
MLILGVWTLGFRRFGYVCSYGAICMSLALLGLTYAEDVYQSCLVNCSNYLHGRLVLSKGDKSLSSKDLYTKLLQLWKPLYRWKMIPLGRVFFFKFCFSTADDLRSVWSNDFWNLKPGLLQYWQDEILFEIAGAIGTPIIIDENTRNNSFGHYARVLVDINFAGFIPDTLCFERDNFSFDIEIEYEHPRYGDKAQSYAVNSLTEC